MSVSNRMSSPQLQPPLTAAAPTTFNVGLTPDEKRLYSQIFKSLDPEGTGIITGDKARSTFEKSGLPPAILGEIWQLADRNNLGFLTQFGFCYAMRLIGHTQSGQAPNPTLAESPGPLPKFANLNLQPQLQAQTTNGAFMQSQPSAIVPKNTTTYQSAPQDPIPPVSPADYKKFSELFIKTVGSATATLPGGNARDIFLKAKLPTPTLGQIWNLVDTENLGRLSLPSFVVAMHLIQGLLSGVIKQLPPFLSDNIWRSAQAGPVESEATGTRQSSYASISSQQTTKYNPASQSQRYPSQREVSSTGEWVATPVMKQQYESVFNNLDKQKVGHLNPDQVASFLMTSKLNQNDLAAIWDLSDIQNTGVFTLLEFSIALFLVNKRLTGVALPNIVPDELLASLKTNGPVEPQPQPTTASPIKRLEEKQPIEQKKTAIDDLVDVFGTSSPPVSTPEAVSAPQPPVLQSRTSSSDLTASELPKVRKNLTSSFKPTSSFGQSLMHKEVASPTSEETSLLGDDVAGKSSDPRYVQNTTAAVPQTQVPPVSQQAPAQQQTQPQPQPQSQAPAKPEVPPHRSVNYDALRAVPPPPRKSTGGFASSPALSPQTERELTFSSYASPAPVKSPNEDLLADPETSGQLSQATTDIANISNQVKSLTTQTSELHEKKGRAEQELNRILATKKEIESKLRQLKTSYENEVQQFEEVETKLNQAQEEAEALRSESSIAEAKFNHISGELNERQVAMENLQKENSSLKEKLGFVNAEIAEVEKQFQTIQEENHRLTNQLNVKKSQVQVVLVRKEELQSQLAEIEASNRKLQEDINRAAAEEAEGERQNAVLQTKVEQAKSFKPIPPAKSADSSSNHSGFMGVAGAAVGAIAGGAAAVASGLASAGDKGAGSEKASDVEPLPQGAKKETEVAPVSSVGNSVPQSDDPSPSLIAPVSQVSALVDEVKEKPSTDLTGIDDLEQVDDASTKDSETLQGGKARSVGDLSKEVDNSNIEDATNATTMSSVTTDKTADGETPITSPSNSEFQFPQGGNPAIVGGLVGMPGVLVGVQRTDSLTSSVQNNAALSVRDDNIEVSDRETLGNGDSIEDQDAAPSNEEPKENPESDKLSSGVESFEIVNADEAKEGQYTYKEEKPTTNADGMTSNSFVVKNPLAAPTNIDDEFPPIRDLDYDESDSSEDVSQDEFDDAKDHLPADAADGKETSTAPVDDFDAAFDGLEPANIEVEEQGKDMFADEFDNLENAKVEDTSVDDFGQENYFSNDFTSSNMPDFSQPSTKTTNTGGNDEWEQLFAGFGNANEVPQATEPQATEPQATEPQAPTQAAANFPPSFEESQSTRNEALIQELVGMGFDEKTAIAALEREHWDLQSATNYLLDNV